MKRYDTYKDSGVEWIGEIPSHWINSRLKYVSEIVTGNTPPTKDDDNYEGGEFLWVKPNEINGLVPTNDTKQKLTIKGRSLSRVLPPFSVLVNGIGRIGEFGFSEFPVSTNQQINSIVYNDKVDNRYGIFHVSMMKEGFLSNSEKVVVPILNKTKQENIDFILPPLPEQQQIVSYLDTKTTLIDSLIEKTQRKIELLKEKRTSLINEVVTKGLNPNVEMKDSGVEWIGEIPSHWENPPLRYYFSYTKGSNGQKLTKSYIDDNRGEYPVYSGQTDNDGIMGFVNEFEFDYQFPLIFTTTVGAKYMTTKILQGKFSLSQNCLVMVKKKECIPSFIEYFLKIDFQYRKELIPIIIQPSLRMEDLDRVNIIVPPLSEQQQIVEYLDEQTHLIDNTTSIEEKRIELLKEYRQSMISEVVTGKLKVTTDE